MNIYETKTCKIKTSRITSQSRPKLKNTTRKPRKPDASKLILGWQKVFMIVKIHPDFAFGVLIRSLLNWKLEMFRPGVFLMPVVEAFWVAADRPGSIRPLHGGTRHELEVCERVIFQSSNLIYAPLLPQPDIEFKNR